MKIALIDNDDSFIHNLKQLFIQAGAKDVKIINYRDATLNNLAYYDKLVFGPGPGVPSDYPDIIKLIQELNSSKSILGVCLGFQFIIEAFGGSLTRHETVKHGIVKEISHNGNSVLYQNIPSPFQVGLYNSWIADVLTNEIEITATSGKIPMSVQHKQLDITGVQYHPESFLTPQGKQIIQNWLFVN